MEGPGEVDLASVAAMEEAGVAWLAVRFANSESVASARTLRSARMKEFYVVEIRWC